MYCRAFQRKSTAGRKLSVEPPDRPQVSSQPDRSLPQLRKDKEKNHKLSKIESKCNDLEIFKHLLLLFNNLTLGLFYFGSLAGCRLESPDVQCSPLSTHAPITPG